MTDAQTAKNSPAPLSGDTSPGARAARRAERWRSLLEDVTGAKSGRISKSPIARVFFGTLAVPSAVADFLVSPVTCLYHSAGQAWNWGIGNDLPKWAEYDDKDGAQDVRNVLSYCWLATGAMAAMGAVLHPGFFVPAVVVGVISTCLTASLVAAEIFSSQHARDMRKDETWKKNDSFRYHWALLNRHTVWLKAKAAGQEPRLSL